MAEVVNLQQSNINYSYSEFLPDVVRVLNVQYEFDDHLCIRHMATVYGNAFQARVTWTSMSHDEQIAQGAMARVFWPHRVTEVNGLYPVVRLVPVTRVDAAVNLFDTVPPSWSKDILSLRRAKELWEQLPDTRQRLFNELLWDPRIFRRYICIPASLNSHHNGWGGNLRHAVEVAEHAERIALDVEGVSSDFLILAGLLHNVASIGAYDFRETQWASVSETMALASQRYVQEALEEILDRLPGLLAEQEACVLKQVLFGQRGAILTSDQLPIRTLETEILQMADRLSCVVNMHSQGGVL